MSDDKLKNWTIEQCREAHLGLKEHPWRHGGDIKHLKSYCRLLNDFVKATYWLAEKRGHNDLGYKVIAGMQHDLYGSLRRLERTNGMPCKYSNSDGSTHDDETVTHIENCIQVMHRFLNGGTVDRYWTYYTGCNNIPGVRRFHSMKYWQPDKTKPGRFIPELPIDELRTRLAYYENQKHDYYADLVACAKQQIVAVEAGLI